MFRRIKFKLYKIKRRIINNPNIISYVKSCYYSYLYVDEYDIFPCFKLNNKIKLNIYKGKDAKLIIKKKIILNPWLNQKGDVNITLGSGSILKFNNEFTLGQNIAFFVNDNAKLTIEGGDNEAKSGITANSVIMVNESIKIGKGSIVAFDTFITDCDWHAVENSYHTYPTSLEDNVWIGSGVKILKGVNIGSNSIVTANSVVLKGNYQEYSFLSGNPAKLLGKKAPKWSRNM